MNFEIHWPKDQQRGTVHRYYFEKDKLLWQVHTFCQVLCQIYSLWVTHFLTIILSGIIPPEKVYSSLILSLSGYRKKHKGIEEVRGQVFSGKKKKKIKFFPLCNLLSWNLFFWSFPLLEFPLSVQFLPSPSGHHFLKLYSILQNSKYQPRLGSGQVMHATARPISNIAQTLLFFFFFTPNHAKC